MHCDNKFDCAMFMVFHDCRGCNDGYTQNHYDNDHDHDDVDFIG